MQIGIPFQQASVSRAIDLLQEKAAPYLNPRIPSPLLRKLYNWMEHLRQLGVTANMDNYERRKLRVFNLLNFFQFVFGIIIPITAIITRPKISTLGWIAACMPALVSLLVLYLNSRKFHEVSTLSYFILYPVITSIVYLSGMNLGIELFFILYGILAVFFIQDIGHMVFTVTLSMISYFVLTVVWRNFQFQLEVNGVLYLLNHLIAIVFIFFALFLVKKENTNYQQEIATNISLLDKQAAELKELNALKNKLFSVIAHDLKSPMYALRNIFANIQKYDIPAEDVKSMVPEVMKDLNYTTSLMENLLQWSKSQMQSHDLEISQVNMSDMAHDVLKLLHNEAAAKQVNLIITIPEDCMVMAQKDMIKLVLRNLVSNAIKFTPPEGYVAVGMEDRGNEAEIYVEDTGVGIPEENLLKLRNNDYFTTQGTHAEKGTGLGLMLCKEFLSKYGSALHFNSEAGKGSTFSFSLKKA